MHSPINSCLIPEIRQVTPNANGLGSYRSDNVKHSFLTIFPLTVRYSYIIKAFMCQNSMFRFYHWLHL